MSDEVITSDRCSAVAVYVMRLLYHQ